MRQSQEHMDADRYVNDLMDKTSKNEAGTDGEEEEEYGEEEEN